TRSRRPCRSGRRRSSRAARSGSAARGHEVSAPGHARTHRYSESMTYDPWEPREAPAGTLPQRPADDPPFQSPVQERRGVLRRAGGGIAAGGLLALKLLGNLAFLFKFKFLFSFLISAALYTWAWGWQFGVGFILLLLVHEMGHVIQLKRE